MEKAIFWFRRDLRTNDNHGFYKALTSGYSIIPVFIFDSDILRRLPDRSDGTGCDAAPYFRVFNPELQRFKFDPKGTYVSRWIPEWNSLGYPEPMVDHQQASRKAIAEYSKVKKLNK